MQPLPAPTSLLDELDRRQDEVLAELDELEQRLAAILAEYGGQREAMGPTIYHDAA